MNALIIRNTESVSIDIVAEAVEQRDALIQELKDVTAIEDEFMQSIAVEALRKAQRMLVDVESARKEVKAPVLQLERDIDSKAKTFVSSLDAEMGRVKAILNKFNADQHRRRQEEERKRQEEQRRLDEERRKAEEAAAAPFTAEESQQANAAIARIEQQQKALAIAPTPKPKGMSVEEVWRFDVTDIKALANHSFELVRVEPNRAAINESIKRGMRECPGLRIWKETVTEVRKAA